MGAVMNTSGSGREVDGQVLLELAAPGTASAPGRRQPTLGRRLLAWGLGALLVVWVAMVAAGFHAGWHEADELTDGHLAGVATLLLAERDNRFADERLMPPPPPSGAPLRAHDYQRSMSVAVWGSDGHLLSRFGSAPTPAFEPGEGYATLKLGQPATRWRAYARWNGPSHDRRVMVLVSMPEHDDLAWDIAGQVAEPGLWLLPVVAVVLGWALRRAMQPLRQLADRVDALDIRTPKSIDPIPSHRELAQLAHAINTLGQRYQATLANERQLANEMAHELRTPLASLALHAANLRGPLADEDQAQALERIERDAKRVAQMVDQLLALARASRVELEEAAVECDLAAIGRDVLGRYAQFALVSGHSLSMQAPETLLMRGHPMLLDMTLCNLVENALAHTPAGTSIELALDAPGRWLQVSDDGERVAARSDRREEIQSPTAPAAAAGRSSGPGLGLGLGHRLAHKVAAMHGGRFGVATPAPTHTTTYRMTWGVDQGG